MRMDATWVFVLLSQNGYGVLGCYRVATGYAGDLLGQTFHTPPNPAPVPELTGKAIASLRT